MLTVQIGFIISGIIFIAGAAQWVIQKRKLTRQDRLLTYVKEAGDREKERQALEERRRKEEEETQSRRCFGLDFLITHGTAFGGCAATGPDGRVRRGFVPLDHVMMYGRQPSGKDYTYYIEDQGLMICAGETPDTLILKSEEQPFEIREAGLSRDQGQTTKSVMIREDILYYIILESRHEISIRATACC